MSNGIGLKIGPKTENKGLMHVWKAHIHAITSTPNSTIDRLRATNKHVRL
jgi:hypothetical protein